MTSIVLIYASMSGNTEMMAESVAEGVREAGGDIKVIDIMTGAFATDLESFQGVIIGSYTWGNGELPDDFLDYYEELDNIDLTGKKAAVFGSGDTGYNYFCAAVDILMEKLSKRGAKVFQEGLKVDLTPGDEEEEACRTLGRNFVGFLNDTVV